MPVYTGAPDATTGQKGKLKLAGDLDGTAESPEINTSVSFLAYRSADYAYSASTWTRVNCNTEEYDLGGNYDTTNFRFVAPVAGVYLFTGQVTVSAGNKRMLCELRKNNLEWKRGSDVDCAANRSSLVAAIMLLEESDYVDLWMWSDLAGNVDAVFSGSGNAVACWLSGVLVGRVE